mmetsp:Transcript_12082/g.36683  ORF Transcript_12082/g.36683 Transcript_12082/m.36683 type:complete len:300 (-) Transcript_12082:33-932(-)
MLNQQKKKWVLARKRGRERLGLVEPDGGARALSFALKGAASVHGALAHHRSAAQELTGPLEGPRPVQGPISTAGATSLELPGADEGSESAAGDAEGSSGRRRGLRAILLGHHDLLERELGFLRGVVGEDHRVALVLSGAREGAGRGGEGAISRDRAVAAELGLVGLRGKQEGSVPLAHPLLVRPVEGNGAAADVEHALPNECAALGHELSLTLVLRLTAEGTVAIALGGLDPEGSLSLARLHDSGGGRARGLGRCEERRAGAQGGQNDAGDLHTCGLASAVCGLRKLDSLLRTRSTGIA